MAKPDRGVPAARGQVPGQPGRDPRRTGQPPSRSGQQRAEGGGVGRPSNAGRPPRLGGSAPPGHGQDRESRQARQFGDRPTWDPPARSVARADGAGAPAGRTAADRRAAPSGPASPQRERAPVKPRASDPASRPDSSARRAVLERREYDPRREERRKATRVALPDDVDAQLLPADARRELRALSKETADLVARHLVRTGQLLDDDPEQALAHARAARALAARIGVVREAVGLAAYAGGQWAEALSELRAARRITGRPEHLAVLADCERALGRAERALGYADDPDVPGLPQDERVELIIVLAGARADLGQLDAAVLTLQDASRRTVAKRPWAVRLWYAYADALLGAGRQGEAREWFARTAEVDVEGETDAGDQVLLLDGVVFEDFGHDDAQAERDVQPDEGLATYIRQTYTGKQAPPAADQQSPPARGDRSSPGPNL